MDRENSDLKSQRLSCLARVKNWYRYICSEIYICAKAANDKRANLREVRRLQSTGIMSECKKDSMAATP